MRNVISCYSSQLSARPAFDLGGGAHNEAVRGKVQGEAQRALDYEAIEVEVED